MMKSDMYWWTNTGKGPNYSCYNAFGKYAHRLIKNYGTNIGSIRKDVTEYGDRYMDDKDFDI